MKPKHLRQLLGRKMRQYLKAQASLSSLVWLEKVANTGKVPIAQYFEDHVPAGEFGRGCKIVDGNRSAEIRLVEPISPALFWKIPEGRDEPLPPVNLAPEHIPPVGYSRVPVSKRPTYQRSGQRALAEKEDDDTGDGADDNNGSAAMHAEPDQIRRHAVDENDDSAAIDAAPSWGADWTDCKEQSFAVTYHPTDSGTNLNVIKIRQVYEDNGKRSFKGIPWECEEFQNDEACLTSQWHHKRGARFNESTAKRWYDYHVVAYFTEWKTGKNGKAQKHKLLNRDVLAQVRDSGIQFHVQSNQYEYSDSSESDADAE